MHSLWSHDDIQSNLMLVRFDNIDSMFGRLGVKADYKIEDGLNVFAKANMWHQFKGESVISAYRPKTGQLVNSTMDKYTNNTWADLQLGLSMQYESTELFGGIGYIGNFGGDNAVTGRIGLNYRW